MVLEISVTPYIFTFKLWNWDRLVLDGLPRAIHIEDGEKNIQWNRTTSWVKDNLVNHVEEIHDGDDYLEERTGLHELEFIETRRFTSNHQTDHGFNMLNLVEGLKMNLNLIQYIMQKHLLFLQMLKNIQLDL